MRKVVWVVMLAVAAFAGDFDLKTLKGASIHVRNIEGNLLFEDPAAKRGRLILFFFGTSCPYCEKEIPEIEALYRAGRVEVLGAEVQMPVGDAELKRFVKKKGISFRVLDKASGRALARYLLNRKVWIGGVPAYIWVDKYGNLEPMDLKELSRFR